jgi:glycosyltransferase involved in cell wall biosynthesis
VPQKCTADAVRVFARLRAAIPEVRLVVCGSGPELPRLQQQAKDLGMEGAVRFAGHLPHSELLSLLEQAEVTVTMSRSPSERLPNILKEAMLRRCLCLSTRTAGIEELIDDGDTGLIVELGDVDAAVGRLKQVLQHPPTAAEIGWRAQSTIVRDFDVDQLMAERLRQWSAVRQAREPGKAA